MARRTQISHFVHADVQTDHGEVVGIVLAAVDDEGPVEWQLSPDAAKNFLRAVGAAARADVEE